jgi:hypothetical protein
LLTKFAWAKKMEFDFLMGYVDVMGLLHTKGDGLSWMIRFKPSSCIT